jgi:hypothetical protein
MCVKKNFSEVVCICDLDACVISAVLEIMCYRYFGEVDCICDLDTYVISVLKKKNFR